MQYNLQIVMYRLNLFSNSTS